MYKIITTASLLAASTYAAPIASDSVIRRVNYQQYNGDGSAAQGWPTIDQWQSWDQLWSTNSALMAQSCGWNGWGADNSAQETSDVGNAIQNEAGSNGLDARYVLAVLMQESKGCVRVPTTNNGVVNPGLMQSHDGPGSCADVNPCPTSEIYQMVTDGTAGTSSGDGLKQTVAFTGEAGAQGMYAGARKYNSGSVNLADLGQSFGSTASYASDIANRVMGWAN